ncbi:delta(3,5)-Delta(2,4)-dienoyl-CoA isomerase, peroxisomal [Apium graveolens]|uniref:delta(3,5)-Delta(2,4)-dienoyl-CoA isomerase, peroxisomal n=1 Tax=Apium graveolens TaxID=4045 RepID=UPI003D7A0BCD
MTDPDYKSLKITNLSGGVYNLILNQPATLNALSPDFFTEFPKALSYLDSNPDASVILLSGQGSHFCAGIDINSLKAITATPSSDRGRATESLRRHILFMQDAINSIEKCRKPVIACIHGACIGGGVDVITACDIRFCTDSAFFSVKEVDLAIVADLGTLQRLPRVVGYANAMDLALTARRFSASEAKQFGLVSKVFDSKSAMDEAVRYYAQGIAAKSPLAVTGTKAVLLRSRDMTIERALDYVATWNAGAVISDDLTEAISAHSQKRKPVFAKL